MPSKDITEILEELIPHYKDISIGKYAIALAGAHSKGKADIHSDLDIFLYLEDIEPFITRKAVFEEISDPDMGIWISEDIESFPWGGSIDFGYKGIKVETTVRTLNKLNEVLYECLRGHIRIYPEIWTMNGYYSYIYLSEIGFIKSIEDPYGIISDFKLKVKEYPQELKKAIIKEFWWKSRFWVDNFHYKSAINRMDIVYTSGIVNQTIQNIVQVLFAVNEKYFSGDKKVEKELKELEYCPKGLIENLEFLLSASKDTATLDKQRVILSRVINEISNKVEIG